MSSLFSPFFSGFNVQGTKLQMTSEFLRSVRSSINLATVKETLNAIKLSENEPVSNMINNGIDLIKPFPTCNRKVKIIKKQIVMKHSANSNLCSSCLAKLCNLLHDFFKFTSSYYFKTKHFHVR